MVRHAFGTLSAVPVQQVSSSGSGSPPLATGHLAVQCPTSYHPLCSQPVYFCLFPFFFSSLVFSADRIELCIEQTACRVSILRRPSIANTDIVSQQKWKKLWAFLLLMLMLMVVVDFCCCHHRKLSIQLHCANICLWVRRLHSALASKTTSVRILISKVVPPFSVCRICDHILLSTLSILVNLSLHFFNFVSPFTLFIYQRPSQSLFRLFFTLISHLHLSIGTFPYDMTN